MSRATLASLALLLWSTNGYPNQPGTCNSPQPFGNAHLKNGNYRGGTSLSSYGMQVLIGNSQLIEGSTFEVPSNKELDIELKATGGRFKGYLIKLVKDGLDTTNMLISNDATVRDDLAECLDLQSGSLSHTNNNRKSSIKGKLLVGSDTNLSGLKLEVTVAIENDDFSEWYQSSFDLTALAVGTPATTPAATTAATTAVTSAVTSSATSSSNSGSTNRPHQTDNSKKTSDSRDSGKSQKTGSSQKTQGSKKSDDSSNTTNDSDLRKEGTGKADDWYPSLKKRFVGTRLRRCANLNGAAPAGGSKCGGKKRKKKTCFFGDQQCPAAPSFPRTRCFCDGSQWSCAAAPCPTSPAGPVP